jgi:hypothetical protein
LQFDREKTHQTVCGGLVTIAVVLGFGVYFVMSMINSDEFYLKDSISSYSIRSGFKPGDLGQAEKMFKDGHKTFDFKAYINNATYDNNDNPYGKLIMH